MSDSVMCLPTPLPHLCHDAKKVFLCNQDSFHVNCPSLKKTDFIFSEHIYNVAENEKTSKENSSLNEGCIQRQCVSRKREASNELVKSTLFKERTKNFNLDPNVPSEKVLSVKENLSEFVMMMCDESVQLESPCYTDVSDSLSLTDSGIGEISSKGSSPCHAFETFDSPDDQKEQSLGSSGTIDIVNRISIFINEDYQSPCEIEKTAIIKRSPKKLPISNSLFNNVAPAIYFASKEEKVDPMPDYALPFLKWKLSTITPVLIKEIVQKSGFVLIDANTNEEWLGTWGKHLKCNAFKKIKTFQKVNHYPGSFHLGRKDKLWENYKRMQARHGVEAFNFFPETFCLPSDTNSLKNIWDIDDEKCWIIKPPASARGTGIKVVHKWSQIPKNKSIMVQRYLNDPYLINGTKFDLRIYVFVSSIEPLRVYMFDDGLVRFASEKYSSSNESYSNRYVHLTNYSINRKSSSYTANEDENLCQGHKWTLKTFWTYMANQGIDVEKIKESINDMILKTVICSEGPICRLMKTYVKTTYSCYELFGFDIMLDKNLRAWLLEVNISPSLHIRSKLDAKIKRPMVKDMLNMAAFWIPEKRIIQKPAVYSILCPVAKKHKSLRNRCLSQAERNKHSLYSFQNEKPDILSELTPDDVRCLIESEDEFNRRGSFIRLFPSTQSSKYLMYFEHVRYYNLLLDAWENSYHNKRCEGISLLQSFCDNKYHLQSVTEESSYAF